MKNCNTPGADKLSPRLPVLAGARTPPRRLYALLAILALTIAAYVIAAPHLRAPRNGNPAAAARPAKSRGEILLDTGVERAQQHRWLEAIEILDAAARAGADGPLTHRTLGQCLGEMGWIPDTIAEYKEAIRQDPDFFGTYISLATAFRTIGRRAEALGWLGRVEARLQSPTFMEAPGRYARPAAPILEALAEAYGHIGEFPKSIVWATRAQTADPTRAQGYVLAAKSYFVLKQPDQAIPLLTKACTVAPGDPDIHYTLALALRARPTEPHLRSAREHLLTALKLDPNHAPAVFQYGDLCLQAKEWDTALTAFQHAYQLEYDRGQLLQKAAQASRGKGDKLQTAFFEGQYNQYVGKLPEAERCFRQLLSHPKQQRTGRVLVARTQTEMAQYQAALRTLKDAIAQDPKSAELRRQAAGVYDKMHLVTDQVAALKEAAELDPATAHHDYYRMGRIALDTGKYDDAEVLLEKSIALNPNISQYHYSLGQAYLLRPELGDRLPRAIHQLEEAARLAPDDIPVHDFLSTAYMKAGDWQNAAVALHRSADAVPQNKVLYFRLNQVYRRLGSEREARRAQDYYQRLRKLEVDKDLLSRRVKAQPNDPSAHLALGDLLLGVHNYAGARREFEKAVDLRPNDAAIHERLCVVYGELSQPEGQWRELQLFRRLSAPKKT